MKKTIDSAMVLAGCTGLLYSLSAANYHGFLIAANLDSTNSPGDGRTMP